MTNQDSLTESNFFVQTILQITLEDSHSPHSLESFGYQRYPDLWRKSVDDYGLDGYNAIEHNAFQTLGERTAI